MRGDAEISPDSRHFPTNASPTYRELLGVLEKYVSPLLVHSTLRNALSHVKATPSTLERRDLSRVVEHAMVGMRLFCDPERLPTLMVELAELCAHP